MSSDTVTRGRYQLWFCDRYIGTKEALIAGGFAKAEWFPDIPTKAPSRGLTRTYRIPSAMSRKHHVRGELHIELERLRNGRWELRLPVSAEEEERRWNANHAQKPAAEGDKAMHDVIAESGPRAVAEEQLKAGLCMVIRAFDLLEDPDVPWSFDGKTRKAVQEHGRAILGLFASGTIRVKREAQAQRDADFQRFMAKVGVAPVAPNAGAQESP